MLKAVIFDMDGVIIDSEPQHARAALRVLNRHGANADYDYCSSFIGSSTKVFTQDIMKRFPLSISLEELLEEMNLEKKKILKEEGYAIIEGITDLIMPVSVLRSHHLQVQQRSRTRLKPYI